MIKDLNWTIQYLVDKWSEEKTKDRITVCERVKVDTMAAEVKLDKRSRSPEELEPGEVGASYG